MADCLPWRSRLKWWMACWLWGACATGLAQEPAAPRFEPTANYQVQTIRGWKVYVHQSLLKEERELGQRALALLDGKLFDLVRLVPKRHLVELQKVPIWLEHHNPKTSSAQYHPSRQWLIEHDFNPDKAKAVEIARAENFLQEERRQPFLVLHELAHAYHDRTLSFDDARILAAYNRALESHAYASVLAYSGKEVKHYATTNHKEFFAELTECYFGTNDFYPFVRPELKRHDPATYHLLEEIWGE